MHDMSTPAPLNSNLVLSATNSTPTHPNPGHTNPANFNVFGNIRPLGALVHLLEAQYERVSEKINGNETKHALGAVLMAGASRIWKFVKTNFLIEKL